MGRAYDEWLADDSPRRVGEEDAGELRQMYSLVEEVLDCCGSLPKDAGGLDFSHEVKGVVGRVEELRDCVFDAAADRGVRL